jgi:hypothetical protein
METFTKDGSWKFSGFSNWQKPDTRFKRSSGSEHETARLKASDCVKLIYKWRNHLGHNHAKTPRICQHRGNVPKQDSGLRKILMCRHPCEEKI